MDNVVKLVIGFVFVFFFCLGFMFRQKISYLFCPLEKYTGRLYKGKTSYILTTHLIVSFGLCMICFSLLFNIQLINALFDDTMIRISTFFILWIIGWLLFGLLIEAYLIRTDDEYKSWKQDYLTKNNQP
ncbi:MAG: hypothetical protein RL708_66 [Bacteroidota bacterium]|jgi:hypothetical protein